MFGYIDNLKKQSEHKRRKAALLTAGIVTLIVAVVWAINFGMSFN